MENLPPSVPIGQGTPVWSLWAQWCQPTHFLAPTKSFKNGWDYVGLLPSRASVWLLEIWLAEHIKILFHLQLPPQYWFYSFSLFLSIFLTLPTCSLHLGFLWVCGSPLVAAILCLALVFSDSHSGSKGLGRGPLLYGKTRALVALSGKEEGGCGMKGISNWQESGG